MDIKELNELVLRETGLSVNSICKLRDKDFNETVLVEDECDTIIVTTVASPRKATNYYKVNMAERSVVRMTPS
jgi:hypothetical protein